MYKVIIIADGRKDSGLGHIMRCLTISKTLSEEKEIEAKLFIHSNGKGSFPDNFKINAEILEGTDENAIFQKLTHHIKVFQSNLIIIDSYIFSADFYRRLRLASPTRPVIAIDDCGEKKDFPAAGFISFNLAADKFLYPKDLLQYSAIGSQFFPLRSELIGKENRGSDKVGEVKKVLVTMGGSDPENQTIRIAELLKDLKDIEMVELILGPGYEFLSQITEVIGDDKRFRIYKNPSNLAEIMKGADLAITGAGTTCGELIYLKVPIAALVLSENQKSIAKAVENYGCGKVLGYFNAISDEEILAQIKELIRSKHIRESMVKKCKGLIDGKGNKRLAEFIKNYLEQYHVDKYTLPEVLEEYELSAKAKNEYEKLKWGTYEGMLNRYHLAQECIDWKSIDSWLDVGCGTGAFLKEIEKKATIGKFLGVDLSSSLVQYAASHKYKTENVSFCCQNFMANVKGAPFDLVTCIGVLHKCGLSLRKAVARLSELVKSGGKVFVTTKNLDWQKFKEKDFKPYPGHHWFHLEDIQSAFSLAGFKVVRMEGFEPRLKGKVCRPQESHSIYVVAEKEN